MVITEEVKNSLAEYAIEAAANAYCRYSNFPVGAVVLLNNGQMILGCNVENVSYGLSVCAERVAVFKAIAEGFSAEEISVIAVYTPTQFPAMPCGACRQVLREFVSNCEVISFCDGPEVKRTWLSALLPNPLGADIA